MGLSLPLPMPSRPPDPKQKGAAASPDALTAQEAMRLADDVMLKALTRKSRRDITGMYVHS
jgi:hypothetical protein